MGGITLDIAAGEVRGTGILIYSEMPNRCPFRKSETATACGGNLYGVAKATGAPDNVRAYACETGHRLHVRIPEGTT